MAKLPKKSEALVRALSRTVIDYETGCMTYCGASSGSGRGGDYGRISYIGCTVSVHILSFETFNGRPVRKGKFLDHLCENRRCWNPHHVDEVTQSVNEKRKNRRRKKAPAIVPREWVENDFK